MATPALVAPAHAEDLVVAACGGLLTQDAYLATDLNCTGAGLTLAGDLTLDLRGHRLTGTATQTALVVSTGHSVTVTNGQIDHWAVGVQVGGAPGPEVLGTVTISNVTFADNVYGINGQDSQENIAAFAVTGSRFVRNRDGFHGDFTAALRVGSSSFSSNQTAVYVDTGSSVALTDTRMENNVTGLRCFATVCRALRATARNNRFGFTSGDYGNVEVTDSTVTGNEVGYTAGLGVLTHNTISNNNTGVVVVESGSLQAVDNLFTGNGVGVTSVVKDGYAPRAELTTNTFLRNIDGVYFTLNPDDSDSQSVLQGNLAVGNKRYGIYSPGATDQGGNQAVKNGSNCVGLQCSTDVSWPKCPAPVAAEQPDMGAPADATSSTRYGVLAEHYRAIRAAATPASCIPDAPGIPWRPDPRFRRSTP